MNESIIIFIQFLRRDFYIYRKQLSLWIINYWLLFPALFSISLGYIQPLTLTKTADPYFSTLVSLGNIAFFILIVTYKLIIGLLFDLETDRYIDYQITRLSPHLILLQRVVFTALFGFFLTIPFYPLSKLFLGSMFATDNVSWTRVYTLLFVAIVYATTHNLLAAIVLRNTKTIVRLWTRVNLPLCFLGGVGAPWYILNKHSALLGNLIRFNPIMYITEGLRSAFLTNETNFIPFSTCCLIIALFSASYFAIACYLFKKRVDHI